jgi:hypothetical protein
LCLDPPVQREYLQTHTNSVGCCNIHDHTSVVLGSCIASAAVGQALCGRCWASCPRLSVFA